MNTKKLLSFIRLCQRGCVESVQLASEFENFMNSNYEDAYDYYISKGMHNLCEPISKVKICKWINEVQDENPSAHFNEFVGKVMRKSGGRLDPNIIIEVVNEYYGEI